MCASAYFPSDDDNIPSIEVQGLIQYCLQNTLHYIIGCDANAHHVVWGSSGINRRGECLLEYFTSSCVDILNSGSKPTFINAIREEVLDLTLASPFISNFIENWHVSDEASLSDHQHNRFDIQGKPSHDSSRYDPKSTDWNLYRGLVLSKLDMLVTPIESIGDLDEAAYQLNDVLLTSYHDSCIHKTSLCKRKVPWWNDQLAKLRKQVRKLFNHAKRTKSWDEYRFALTEYNLELRRSKRATWRKCCENIADLPVATRIHKALVKDHANCVGLLKKI